MAGRPEIIKTQLGQRLRDVRSALNDVDRDKFCLKLDISSAALANYERGDRIPNASLLSIYVDKLGVDPAWLMTGKGKMFSSGSRQLSADEPTLPEELAYIPQYDVEASAGNGASVITEEQTGSIALSKDWLLELGMDPTQAGVILARGSSMEPTIPDNAPMVVDMRKGMQFISGKVYVINFANQLLVKRLEQRLDGTIDFLSDNPDVPPQNVKPEEFEQLNFIGTVRFIIKNV